MNTKQLTAAIVLFAAAGAAMADAPYPAETKFVSTMSRAQVVAELQQARAQGILTNGNDYPIVIQARSSLTREQVLTQSKQGNNDSIYAGA